MQSNSVLNWEKIPKKRPECFRLLLKHLAWIEHQFLSGIRDSRKAGSLWGMMRGAEGVRKSIHQSWLAKGLVLGLLCWGLKGVQEDIPSEEASTLQIRSVAFPPGQCTRPQLHPCHKLFDQDGRHSLKLVDKFTYFQISVPSTQNDINTWLAKAWTSIDRLSVIWKSYLTVRIKRNFFQAAVVSILL